MLKKLNSNTSLLHLMVFLRFVGGTLFIPSGLLKIQGKRFSSLCPEMYADIFFQQLQNTGIYWNFLGFCQLLTAFLLYSQRYTVLGVLMFFCICANIFVFTVSMGMNDKTLIMVFMLAIAALLIFWDWNKISVLFGLSASEFEIKQQSVPYFIQIIGILSFVLVVIIFLLTDSYY